MKDSDASRRHTFASVNLEHEVINDKESSPLILSPVSMHPYNMIGNDAVMLPINQIQHHKQQVKTGEQ